MVTLQFIPYAEIDGLSSVGRIRLLLDIAKKDKIALLQGRLKKEEEVELIKATMEEINKDFRGIELAVIHPSQAKNLGFFSKFKNDMINTILGNRQGLTIVGPASVVKQIKRDPKKIELLTRESKSRKKRKK